MTSSPTAIALAAALALAALPVPADCQTPCGSFEVLDVPFDAGWNRALFEDVAALPDGTAWAVGYAQLPTPPFGPENVTLAMSWNGSSWTHTPTPYVSTWVGGANDFLHAVAALGPDDVWAAGERHGDAGGLSVGAWLHVLHWDGSSWSEMPVPEPPGGSGINFSGLRVYDIAAFASDDVWFAGVWGEPNALSSVTWRPLAMHWDGSHMTVFPTPVLYTGSNPMHMRQMAAVATDDIWGICRTNTAGGVTADPTVLHWDGSDWSQVSTPSLGQSVVLDDITAAGADDVWVFGHTYFPTTPFALHWDGSGWSVHTDVGYAGSAVALAPDAIYQGTGEITLFDGSSSAVVEDFAAVSGPSVLGMDSPGGCTLWAVGRRFDNPVTGDLAPFAARMTVGEPSPFVAVGAGLAGLHGVPVLAGDGSLVAGTPVSLGVSSARENAPSMLVMGFNELNAPFKGGVLVPAPDVVLTGLATDGTGAWTLAGNWPSGISNATSFTSQVWVLDPAGPKGLSATQALRATTP